MGDYIEGRMSRREYTPCEKESVNTYYSCPTSAINDKSVSEIQCLSNTEDKTKTKTSQWPPTFKSRDLFFASVGFIFFVSDLVSDWRLAVIYFKENQLFLFYLTIGFIFGPSIFSCIISIVWYTMDHRRLYKPQKENGVGSGTSQQKGINIEVEETSEFNENVTTENGIPGDGNNGACNEQQPNMKADSIKDTESKTHSGNSNQNEIQSTNNTDNVENVNDKKPELLQNADTIDSRHGRNAESRNRKRLCFRIVISILQLGRIVRSLEYVVYMIKSWRAYDPSRKKHLQQKAIDQKQDAAILGLIDGFLESALQLILQIYLSVAVPLNMDYSRVITLLLSLGSTSVSHTVYYKTNRKSKADKKNITYVASAIFFLWRICELSPRFLLLALCVYHFTPWIFIAAFIHILCLFLCLIIHDPDLKGMCPNRFFKSAFLFIVSYIGLFCYLNLEEGKIRLRALLYYIVFYLENIVMAVMIFWNSNIPDRWTYSSLSFIPGCLLHFLFMSIFYKLFHPKRESISWLPC